MKNTGKVVLHIPARDGSKRVPKKNLEPIKGKPLIYYSALASVQSNITDDVYINSDSDEMLNCADLINGLKKYKRKPNLASDLATSEDFNLEIIQTLQPDILIMVNPICPFIKKETIKDAFSSFMKSDCDTLISCITTQMQGFVGEKPINIDLNNQLGPSQDNPTISILNWAVTIWDAKKFEKRMKEKGFASLGEKRLLYKIPNLEGFKISNPEDLEFVKELKSLL